MINKKAVSIFYERSLEEVVLYEKVERLARLCSTEMGAYSAQQWFKGFLKFVSGEAKMPYQILDFIKRQAVHGGAKGLPHQELLALFGKQVPALSDEFLKSVGLSDEEDSHDAIVAMSTLVVNTLSVLTAGNYALSR